MKLSLINPGRSLRLALLLLLLTAQGLASAHELGDGHHFATDSCSICITGNGLGAAIGASVDTPRLPRCHIAVPVPTTAAATVSFAPCHPARAPPVSLRTNLNLD